MTRVPAWSLLPIAITVFASGAFFPAASPGAELSSAWTIAYTDLKANLRALAGDPHDPRRVYLGTDEKIVASSDGGRTWTDLQSFRDDKIALSSLPSDKASRYLSLIETPEEMKARAKMGGGGGAVEEGEAGRSSLEGAGAEAAAAAAQAKLQDLQSRQGQAEEEAKKAEAALALALAEQDKWQEEDLTAAQVESIEETGNDFVPEPDYSLLADWLEERGLPVVTSGGERKRTLIDYLQKHELERLALAAEVAAREKDLDVAQSGLESLEAQVEAARAERDQAAAALAAPRAQPAESEARTADAAAADAEPTPGPGEEYISGVAYLAVDPARPQRILAATFDGIFLSQDRGASWKLVYRGTGAGQSAIVCLAFDPSRPATVFGGSLSGLVRSADGGMTWERVEGIIADKVVISLAIHPSDSRIVFAGTEGDGLFQSVNGGRNWRQVFTHSTSAGNGIRSIAFAPSRPEVVWLATEAGVFVTFNGGRAWQKPLAQGLADTDVQYLAAAPADPAAAYAATPSGVFATADSGRTFRRITFGLSFRNGHFLAFEPGSGEALWLVTDQRVCRQGPRSHSGASSSRERGASLRPKR